MADVELDLFSGRPNPVWTLAADDAAKAQSRLASLGRSWETMSVPALGYRGLILRLHEHDAVRRVLGGLVAFDDPSGGALEDSERGFEAWLLKTGQPYLDQSMFRLAQAALREM